MSKEPSILVVEDDPNDTFLLEWALRKAQVSAPVRFFRDGQEILDCLQGMGSGALSGGPPLPGLILLDLKMPLLDGFEVLQWLRARPVFDSTRVVVLSGLEDRASMARAYALGANEYWLKPEDPAQLVRCIRRVTQSPELAALPQVDLAPAA